jgi:foldase protein PrsA
MVKRLKKIKLPFKLTEKTKKKLIIGLAILCLGLFLFNYKNLLIAAMVNNRPITRLSLIRELEKQAGQQTLDTLISKSLILQEAEKQNIKIGQERIEEKIKEIEDQVKSQGADLDTLLANQGQTRKSLEGEIKIQLLIEEMVGKDIQITDEELKNYFEENKEFLGENPDFETMKEGLREQLRQQKINDQLSAWLEDLKSKANIHYFLKF